MLHHRPKRSQVRRACDACRLHKTKCDNNSPCSNCITKSRHCSNDGGPLALTLSQAQVEIRRLQQRVQELEIEEDVRLLGAQIESFNTPISNRSASLPSTLSQEETNKDDNVVRQLVPWEGVILRPSRSPNTCWFGPFSQFHFIHRLSVYLSSALQQTQPPDSLLFQTADTAELTDQDPTVKTVAKGLVDTSNRGSQNGMYLSPMQEDYFLSLFWDSYQKCWVPLLNEVDFKKYHQSLWAQSGAARQPSALVDIMLALCIQSCISTLPSTDQKSIGEGDATIAGRHHYRRAQDLLAHEIDSPTFTTVQCHLLSAVYLCAGSFHNMVSSSVGYAVQAAYTLGLHTEITSQLSEAERQVRRRLWWGVYLMDTKISLKLGHPFSIHVPGIMPQLPDDSFEAAAVDISGSSLPPIGDDASWLSFNLLHIKLHIVFRNAHDTLHGVAAYVHSGNSIWEDPRTLEDYAEMLSPYLEHLREWLDSVPSALKTSRQNGGVAFSTDGSILNTDLFAPVWLSRQRLLLELAYHQQAINLYRLFISFKALPTLGSKAEQMATRCAAHAVSLTMIAHHVLSTSSILDGWHELFQWQWSAALALVGYTLVFPMENPVLPLSPVAAIDLAVETMSRFADRLPPAASATNILSGLRMNIEFLREKLRASHQHGQELSISLTNDSDAFARDPDALQQVFTWPSATDNGQSLEDLDTSLMDVDFWNPTDMLWPDIGFDLPVEALPPQIAAA